ncbi:NERD domain-containing protein [Candidatus Nitrosocosmicus franklandus]|uniref:NERD domain-containing protein n=1 Tax=Candidatus Nitrosocosmicus franklandianus TaxID=1798806 RepID=UPI0015591081|nr:NERD domain-containing protein [Candidatus Nitrosocosmicus franklandus]
MHILRELSSSPAGVEINKDTDPEIHNLFLSKGVIVKNNFVENTSSNKISLGIAALSCGADVFEICKILSWKDFEILSSEILKFHDYVVYFNYRIRNPTRQIDIIAIKSKIALVIDCKHWKNTSFSSLQEVVIKQKDRSVRLGERKEILGVQSLYPIIVTFLKSEFQNIQGVPIVPIQNFNSFLLDFDTYNHEFFVI